MVRRLIAVTALAAGMSIAAAMTLATPALAKGPSQARITGPGLVRAVVVSGNGEPGEQGRLANLALQTGLFTVMFGAGASIGGPAPTRLHTPPPKVSLGPRYTLVYTVPGVTPQPGQQYGRVRQDLYPRAAGGPLIYTPPGQQGFGGPLTVTGWLRGRPPLTRTLAQLGVPPPPGTPAAQRTRHAAAARPAAAQRAGAGTPGGTIAPAAVIAAAALIGTTLWLRRRKPTAPPEGGPRTSESA
jgi:hypothetical protein